MNGRSFFLGFVLALVLGVPVTLAALAVSADQIPALLGGVVGAIIIVVILAVGGFLLRNTILRSVGLHADQIAADAVDPAVAAVRHAVAGRDEPAAEAAGKALRTLASWYLAATARRWMLATVIGLLAAFAALLGSALLARQNALILEQNRMLTEQVRLSLAQVHAATVLDVAKTARELMLKAWEVQELRPMVDPSAPNKDPKRLDGFVKVLIQHHVTVYLHSRLGNLPKEFQENVERDTERFFCIDAVKKVWKEVERAYSQEVRSLAARCN